MAGKLVYLALGDSITFGHNAARIGITDYVSLLAAFLQYRLGGIPVTCVNAGVPGATVNDLASTTLSLIKRWHPDIVTCLIGGNDVLGYGTAARGKRQFHATLRSIIDTCISERRIVILGTLPYISHYDWSGLGAIGSEEERLAYCEIIRSIAKEYDLPLADLSSAFGTDLSVLDSDGQHPSQAGHDLIYTLFRQEFENCLQLQ